MIKMAVIYNNGDVKGFIVKTMKDAEEIVLKEASKGIKRADVIELDKPKTRKRIW